MRSFHLRIQLETQSKTQRAQSDTFTPASLFQKLPSHNTNSRTPARSALRRNTLLKASGRDYRLGPIRIDWIDLLASNTMVEALPVSEQKEQYRSTTPHAVFIPGATVTSGSTNLPEGIVHIFRDGKRTSGASTSISKVGESSGAHSRATSSEGGDPDGPDSTIVAVLAVPPWMNPSDFLAFVAPAADGMAHLRLIRDTSPNRNMAMIQFREASAASEFIEEFNGRPFNSVEPEICNIVRVKSVRVETDDPVTVPLSRSYAIPNVVYELPTCPVCLDRMDATVTGLVTVPCSHTFHCTCLSKWGDSRCPVCRYSQNALSTVKSASSGRVANSGLTPANTLASCSDCDSRINLWICLICGNIGCGRLGRAHAKGHYELTGHVYSLELETQRVWDYAGDNYVHRLIQNKDDGKLVELPSASSMDEDPTARARPGQGPDDGDNLKAEKVEIMAMQYSQVLQRALDDQRESYEEQMSDMRKKQDDTQKKLELLSADVQRQMRETREDWDRMRKEEEERRAHLEREKVKSDKKAEKLAEVARKLEKELKEERMVSEGLMKNLGKMKERAETADKEKADLTVKVAELEDQVRDVMFFLEANAKIEHGGGQASEAAGGSIEIPPQQAAAKKKKKAR
ncbi:BRCA1-associated protein [Rickenella mellea]|uniref:BRCA1-associated protein n=1 Tax=Rickenella mellea TaxID=50990 RepID=A0A4Y7Q903_9AGAM|nr:BRCA1-associated protein [Rickenella mellea]